MKLLPLLALMMTFVVLGLMVAPTGNGSGRSTLSFLTGPAPAGSAGAPNGGLPAGSRRGGGPGPDLFGREGLAVVGPPSIDAATIRRVLQKYGSPAVNEAETIYRLGQQYNIDPAICLAFFIVESQAGTRGMATETRSVGNIRATPGYVNHKGYRKYNTWRDGIEDWYRLIDRLYINEWRLSTVETIVPVYAPAEDSNDPASYIATVRRLVNEWRSA